MKQILLASLLLTGVAPAAQTLLLGSTNLPGTKTIVNANFAELYNLVGDLQDLASLVEGDESINGQKTFEFSPRVTVLDLVDGTELVIGKSYQRDISEDTAITFTGSPSEGSRVSLQLRVIGTPTITFPSSKRSGEADTAVTAIRLWQGLHTLQWEYIDSEWVLYDTVYARIMVTTTDPTINSDLDQGFGIGSTWSNTTDDGFFICANADDGAAVWKEVGGAGGTGEVDLSSSEVLSYTMPAAGAFTTGTSKMVWHAPYDMTIEAVALGVGTAATTGVTTFDINTGAGGGTTILSTKLTLDATEDHTSTAATPYVLSATNVAAGTRMTLDVDAVGATPADARLYLTVIPWDGTGGSGGGGGAADYLTNLASRIEFEEGTGGTVNDSVGTLVGTGTGEFITPSKVGTYGYKTESGERPAFGDVTTFAGKSAITASMWYKRESGTSTEISLMRKYTTGSSFEVYLSMTSGTTPKLQLLASGGATATSNGTAVSDTNWHHIAWSFDGTNQRLYQDGVLVDTDALSGVINNNSASFIIGAFTDKPTITVDDFRVYDEVLDTTKLAAIIAAANP